MTNRKLYWRSDFNRAIRSNHWKLLHDKRSASIQLFDVRSDPGESAESAESNPATVQELMKALDAWEDEMAAPSWPRVMNYRHQDELGSFWFAI